MNERKTKVWEAPTMKVLEVTKTLGGVADSCTEVDPWSNPKKKDEQWCIDNLGS